MLWPAVGALLGSSFPSKACVMGAALLFGILALLLVFGSPGTGSRLHSLHLKRGFEGTGRRYYSAFFLFLIFFCAGSFRGFFWESKMTKAAQLAAAGKTHLVALRVLTEPRTFPGRTLFTGVIVDDVVPGGLKAQGLRAAVTAYYTEDAGPLLPGDVVILKASLGLPRRAMNFGEFDYRSYLRSQEIFLEIKGTFVESRRCPLETKDFFTVLLGRTRRVIKSRIEETLPSQEGALLKSLFLGERDEIPDVVETSLKASGFYRFILVTGFHVDVFSSVLMKAARKLTRRYLFSRIATVAMTFLYASVLGWNAGVTRAFISASMRILAPCVRRKYDPLAGLSVAALVLAWEMPYPLYDAGLQLTFLGSLGSWLGKCLGKGTGGFSSAIWMLLFLWPVLAVRFGNVSLGAFLAGGAWACLSAVLIFLGIASFVLPGFSVIFGWLPFLLLRGALFASSFLSRVPLVSLGLPAPFAVEIAAYYVLLLALSFPGPGLPRYRSIARVAFILMASLTLFVSTFLRFYSPWPEVTFFSVGQGDCALIRYRRAVVLVDTGTAYATENTVLPALSRRGIRRIDLLVISHFHQDHAGGVDALLSGLFVEAVLVPPGTGKNVQQIAGSRLPRILEAVPTTGYTLDGLEISMLYPSAPKNQTVTLAAGKYEGENEASLVFSVEAPGGFYVEFWGDAPSEVISSVLSTNGLLYRKGVLGEKGRKMDIVPVVKVPHHGSAGSLVEGFYERLRGGHGVISVGPNPYGHPSESVMYAAKENGVSIWRTDLHGQITVRMVYGKARMLPFLRTGAGG
ncbi:MAG: ComEC/Rec2 family competence protein [Candidatus Fermentithermobacillus carboniphilus]|uniref:ComEC/Rec2 family competence protein n=1 Tax=Candidatus Fermentithermobacillus carboniphilus TaxID=3085328 RepID=A0AAT9L8V9_9FIRM|nr:MAG: ComEC/Rec2 family competence protein [Candidatus Fermentithermobacillus carboniphilus]